jgi:hypothetical protein
MWTHLLFADPTFGVVFSAVWLLFCFSIVYAAAKTIFLGPGAAAANQGFTYVSTVIAGLVLSVASGVFGKPPDLANLPQTLKPAAMELSTAVVKQQATPQGGPSIEITNPQRKAWQDTFADTFIVAGLISLLIFMVE